MKKSCKNCLNRFPGCHSSCKDYLEWRARRDEQLASNMQETTLNQGFYDRRKMMVLKSLKHRKKA